MAWITTKDGRKVNTDWFTDDERKKYMQIEAAQEEAKRRTDVDKSSSKNAKAKKLVEEFTAKTGIQVSNDVQNECSLESLQTMFDTITTLKEKYGDDIQIPRIEKATDAQIYTRDEDGKIISAAAAMMGNQTGALYINTNLFGQPRELIDAWFSLAMKTKQFSSKVDLSTVIAHELAHNMLPRRIMKMVEATGLKGLQAKIQKSQIMDYLENNKEVESIKQSNPTYKRIVESIQKILAKNSAYTIGSHAAENSFEEMICDAFGDDFSNGADAKELSKDLCKLFFLSRR